jgi:hypothetical protein
LKKGTEINWIEIFNESDYIKYNGDRKWAIASRLVANAHSTPFEAGKKYLVTGKMTRVKNVADTSKSCGIVTGKLVEIIEIQDL